MAGNAGLLEGLEMVPGCRRFIKRLRWLLFIWHGTSIQHVNQIAGNVAVVVATGWKQNSPGVENKDAGGVLRLPHHSQFVLKLLCIDVAILFMARFAFVGDLEEACTLEIVIIIYFEYLVFLTSRRRRYSLWADLRC
jgi:hypothetical protein